MSPTHGTADGWSMAPSGRIRGLREEAQTMAEYVVVLAVITPFVVLGFATFGSAIIPTINQVTSYL